METSRNQTTGGKASLLVVTEPEPDEADLEPARIPNVEVSVVEPIWGRVSLDCYANCLAYINFFGSPLGEARDTFTYGIV
jgi:hypothetical protein